MHAIPDDVAAALDVLCDWVLQQREAAEMQAMIDEALPDQPEFDDWNYGTYTTGAWVGYTPKDLRVKGSADPVTGKVHVTRLPA